MIAIHYNTAVSILCTYKYMDLLAVFCPVLCIMDPQCSPNASFNYILITCMVGPVNYVC